MNRLKTYQSLKIQKENENTDIKTQQKIVQAKEGFGVTGKMMGSYLEKTQDNFPGKLSVKYNAAGNKNLYSRESSCSNLKLINPYKESTDSYVKSIGIFPNHKPLSPYMAPTPGPKPRLGQRQIKRQSKVENLPEMEENISQEIQEIQENQENQETKVDFCLGDDLSIREEFKEPLKSDELNLEVDLKDVGNSICSSRIDSTPNTLSKTRSESPSNDISFLSSKFDPSSLVQPSESGTILDLDLCSLGSSIHGSEIYHTAPLLPVPKNMYSVCSTCRSRQTTNPPTNRNENNLNRLKKTKPEDAFQTELREKVRTQRNLKSALKKIDASPKEFVSDSYRTSETGKSKIPKRVSTFCQTLDNSFADRKRKTITKFDQVRALSDETDMESVRVLKPHYEKHFAYFKKDSEKLISSKRVCGTELAKKESLLKKAVPNNELTARSTLIEYPSQIEMKLHISDLSESDEKIKKAGYTTSVQKQQVDVTFRNVKSLKKEIIILRALGDRLEATLNRTASEPSISPGRKRLGLSSSNSMASLTKELKKIDSSINVFPGRRAAKKIHSNARSVHLITECPQKVGYLVFAKGLLHVFGIVEEFEIVPKTIDELRKDPSSNFYIPKHGKFECTSFEKLKAEPQILMQNLKSKSDGLQFNFLDHDPIFFNSLFMPSLTAGTCPKKQNELRSETFKSPEYEVFKETFKSPEYEVFKETFKSPEYEVFKDVEEGSSHDISKKFKTVSCQKTQFELRSKLVNPPRNDVFKDIDENSMQEDIPIQMKAIFKSEKSKQSVKNISKRTFQKIEQKEKEKFKQTFPINYARETKIVKQIKKVEKDISDESFKSFEDKTSASPVLAPRRSRIRRYSTPMPMNAYDDPKNSLWKNLLIGFFQVSIFLGLITALSLPDVRC